MPEGSKDHETGVIMLEMNNYGLAVFSNTSKVWESTFKPEQLGLSYSISNGGGLPD